MGSITIVAERLAWKLPAPEEPKGRPVYFLGREIRHDVTGAL